LPPEEIHIVGCPLFKRLKPRQDHPGKNVVFFPIALGKGFKIDKYITEELRKLKKSKQGINVITKITENRNPDDYVNPIYTETSDQSNLNVIAGILSIADVVIGAEESTPQLLAQYLDIPTIFVHPGHYITTDGLVNNELDKRQLADDFFSTGIKKCQIGSLIDTIHQQLENPDELKEGRKQACIDFGGTHIKNPIKKTVKTIKEIYEKDN
jgi:hypothetical protein